MRCRDLLWVGLALAMGSACLDFETAERSFCNHMELEGRYGLCGIEPPPAFTADPPSPGGIAWVRTFGGDGAEEVTGLAAAPSGELWAAGHVTGSGDLGTGALPAQDTPASFVYGRGVRALLPVAHVLMTAECRATPPGPTHVRDGMRYMGQGGAPCVVGLAASGGSFRRTIRTR